MQLAATVITYIFLLGLSQKILLQELCRLLKSITARKIFKEYPEIRKQLWDGELWSDGRYIGTVGDGTTSDIITNYVQNQGNKEEKQAYKQMKIIYFN